MHVQASEDESNLSQAKKPVEIIPLQHPLIYDQHDLYLCLGDRKTETTYATVRVRRPGARYTSPTRARKGSIFGTSEGRFQQLLFPKVSLGQCLASSVFSKHLLKSGWVVGGLGGIVIFL